MFIKLILKFTKEKGGVFFKILKFVDKLKIFKAL